MAPVEAVVPVSEQLAPLLLGGGLRRGCTVEVALGGPVGLGRGLRVDGAGYAAPPAAGGSTLLLNLLAGASAGGCWCALVGAPGLGLAAAAEAGVDLRRLALVPAPGSSFARVVGALVDGFDLVVVAPSSDLSSADARAASARARRFGAVLVSAGPWPGADVRFAAVQGGWEGLGEGHGRLRERRLQVRASGRGVLGGTRQIALDFRTYVRAQ
ncbi:MAG: hypothetical protein ACT4QG_04715 [Sporichthyaceae bacterium]